MEGEFPELCEWGDMSYEMVEELSRQVPSGITVQFHNNGDPLLYPRLGDALRLFDKNIRCLNTNAKLLADKAGEIIGNLDTLTVSVIQDDPEAEEQYGAVLRFIELRGVQKPRLVYRVLGEVADESKWRKLPGTVAKRILHIPEGSRNYQREVTIPETGICLDLLTHLAIDRYGNISLCVRFDPEGHLRIGNIKDMTLTHAWYSVYREMYIQSHIAGQREILPGCKDCHYWGVPTGC